MEHTILQITTFFYHPDYTVGSGIAPDHAHKRSQTLLPVGNRTPPQRIVLFVI